uniref:Retrovirus-related Pol polyprotein from transposon TNT 1-94-like beta-barrel domain-containing protein n=2 Tax=Helianthus annuus TaxID=4232 RepID=A0A251VDU9_HELAN
MEEKKKGIGSRVQDAVKIQDSGLETEEMEPSAQTVDEVAEAVVTAVVGEQLLEKEHEPLLEPLADPWCVDEVEKDARACENVYDCAMMAVAKGASACLDSLWYVHSGGSRHMTGCRALLKDFKNHGWGDISFGNNSKGKVLGSGIVQNGNLKFENVKLIDNLKFNLLSVSQVSDKGCGSFFTKDSCKIIGPEMVKKIEVVIAGGKTHLVAQRSGNVYVVDM